MGGRDMRKISTIRRIGICLIAFLVALVMTVPCRAASFDTSNADLKNTISEYLCNWAVDGYTSAYKDITVIADVYSLSTAGSEVTAQALVTVRVTLRDKRVGDIPAVQGMLSALTLADYDPVVGLSAEIAAARTELTEQQRACAEAELNDWYEELSEYINEPFSGNLMLTLKGDLSVRDRLDASSIRVFTVDGSDLVPAESILPQPASTRRQDGIDHMNEILQEPRVPETPSEIHVLPSSSS
jgi:hypothetical protein